MQVNPYLHFNGNCEAALKFYEKALGAKIDMLHTYEGAPSDMPTPPDCERNASARTRCEPRSGTWRKLRR